MDFIKIAFIVSLLFHFTLGLFCYYFIVPLKGYKQAEIIFMPPRPLSPNLSILAHEKKAHPIKHEIIRPSVPAPPFTDVEDDAVIIPEAKNTSPEDTTEKFYFPPQSYTMFWLRADLNRPTAADSLKTIVVQALTLPAYHGPKVGFDRIKNDLFTRNLGHSRLIPLNAVKNAAVKALNSALSQSLSTPVRLEQIPSAEEIAALCAIWNLGQPTQQEIYSQIDSSIKMTAEDLDQVLSSLVDQGLLDRKIVSPQDELLIITPMGSVGIEKSSLNRRNRVYRYKSRIDRGHVMNYLQAGLFSIKIRAATDSTESLERLILQLIDR